MRHRPQRLGKQISLIQKCQAKLRKLEHEPMSEKKKEENSLSGTICSESQTLTAYLYILTGKKREGPCLSHDSVFDPACLLNAMKT